MNQLSYRQAINNKFQKHLEIQVIKRGNIYKKASTGGDEEAEASDFEEDEEL